MQRSKNNTKGKKTGVRRSVWFDLVFLVSLFHDFSCFFCFLGLLWSYGGVYVFFPGGEECQRTVLLEHSVWQQTRGAATGFGCFRFVFFFSISPPHRFPSCHIGLSLHLPPLSLSWPSHPACWAIHTTDQVGGESPTKRARAPERGPTDGKKRAWHSIVGRGKGEVGPCPRLLSSSTCLPFLSPLLRRPLSQFPHVSL